MTEVVKPPGNETRATFSFRTAEIYFSATRNGRGLKERITGRCAPCQRGELNYPGAADPDQVELYLSIGKRPVPLQRGEAIEGQIEGRGSARGDTFAHFVRDSVDKRAGGAD